MFRLKGVLTGTAIVNLPRMANIANDATYPAALAGERMYKIDVPERFTRAAWPRPLLRNGKPMTDTRRLRDSVQYRTSTFSGGVSWLEMGTKVPYAGIHNGHKGPVVTVLPKRVRYLTVPNPKKLSASQVRSAQARDFPAPYYRARNGPRGLGIYGGRDREPVFFLRRSVKIPARPFLYWERARLKWVGVKWAERTGRLLGLGSNYPRRSDGVADVGRRLGGRP